MFLSKSTDLGIGYIHSEHRKGRRSEKSFARRTEEYKKDFLRKLSNRIEEEFKDYKLDKIFFSGNRLIPRPIKEILTSHARNPSNFLEGLEHKMRS